MSVKSPQSKHTPLKKSGQSNSRPCRRNMGVVAGPLATCELCRSHGGCFFQFAATSTLPPSGTKDPEIHLGRTKLYSLMDTLINGVPAIEFAGIGSTRVMLGSSKCRYLRDHLNKSESGRGGHLASQEQRRPAKAESAGLQPVPPKLPPIPPPPTSAPAPVPPAPPVAPDHPPVL